MLAPIRLVACLLPVLVLSGLAVAGPDAPRAVDLDLRPDRERTVYEVGFVREIRTPGTVFVWTRERDPVSEERTEHTFGLFETPLGEAEAPTRWVLGPLPAPLLEATMGEEAARSTRRLTCRVDATLHGVAERLVRAATERWAEAAVERSAAESSTALVMGQVALAIGLALPPSWEDLPPAALLDALLEAAGGEEVPLEDADADLVGVWKVRWEATKPYVEATVGNRVPPEYREERRARMEASMKSLRLEIRQDGTWRMHVEGVVATTGTWLPQDDEYLLTVSDEHPMREEERVGRGRIVDGALHVFLGDAELPVVLERTSAEDLGDAPAAAEEDETPQTWTSLRFRLPITQAMRAGQVAADADPDEVLEETVDAIQSRLDAVGMRGALVLATPDTDGDAHFEVFVADLGEGDVERVTALVVATGQLAFRIEVLPTERYRSWEGGTPPRLADEADRPWRGTDAYPPTPEGFDAFKAAEVARWRKAQAEGAPYRPSHARYRLVPADGEDGSALEHFHVLEAAQGDDDPVRHFGHAMLENARVGTEPVRHMPVVWYEIRREYQNVFADWTGRNVGLPLAIVFNGTWRSAPVIQSQLRDSVQIMLGTDRSYAEIRHEARALAGVLASSVLPIQPVFVSSRVLDAAPER